MIHQDLSNKLRGLRKGLFAINAQRLFHLSRVAVCLEEDLNAFGRYQLRAEGEIQIKRVH